MPQTLHDNLSGTRHSRTGAISSDPVRVLTIKNLVPYFRLNELWWNVSGSVRDAWDNALRSWWNITGDGSVFLRSAVDWIGDFPTTNQTTTTAVERRSLEGAQ